MNLSFWSRMEHMNCNLQKIISDLTVLCAFALFLIQQYNIFIFKRLKVQIKEYNKSGLPWEWDHCLSALYCYFFSVCSHPRHSEVNRHPPLARQTMPSCPILQYCTFYFSLVTLNSTIYKTFRSLTSASYSLDQPHPPP